MHVSSGFEFVIYVKQKIKNNLEKLLGSAVFFHDIADNEVIDARLISFK